MKILTIADEASKFLWHDTVRERLADIDLILAAGDLPHSYLEYIANFVKVPILFVHGNHDSAEEDRQPGGCICIDDDIYIYKGYRILGFGGCIRYNRKAVYQYTQKQMSKKVARMWWKLFKNKGFDILLTHSPAKDINDGPDFPHTGFECFRKLLDKYKPQYFIHGHVHMQYNAKLPRVDTYNETTIINAFERYIFEVPDLE